jgi:hypothetical protein
MESGASDLSDADDLVAALAPVVQALRNLGIPHFVGGSIASSFHCATRSTMAVDLICEFSDDKVTAFVALGTTIKTQNLTPGSCL